MKKIRYKVAVWGALLASAASCTDARPIPIRGAAPSTESRAVDLDLRREIASQQRYRTDPLLDDAKQAILDGLFRRSREPLLTETWKRAGTVARLELAVPSGLQPDAGLEEHALEFVRAHHELWNLEHDAHMEVVDVADRGECSEVVLQQLHEAGLPIVGAGLVVKLTPDGLIRAVRGHVDGRPFPLDEGQALDETDAMARLEGSFPDADVEVAPPSLAVYDPYFVSGSAHDARLGYVFAPPPFDPEAPEIAPHLVDARTGDLAIRGLLAPAFDDGLSFCPGGDPVLRVPRVIVDPGTETPALVDFDAFGGVPTTGADPATRALSIMESDIMQRMYGDAAPAQHLVDPRQEFDDAGNVVVRFSEAYGGVPVLGAGVAVSLRPDGRATIITGRFLHFPEVDAQPLVDHVDVAELALEAYLDLECRGDAACRAAIGTEVPDDPPGPTLAIISKELLRTARLADGQERLTWKFDFPRRDVYVSAEGDHLVAFDAPTQVHAIPHTIRNAAQNLQTEIQDGVPVPGIAPHPDSVLVAQLLNSIDGFYSSMGRNGWDGFGSRVDVRVRLPVNNAFWSPQGAMGFGATFTGDDVVGHELTHGVVQSTANLIYTDESGALNESFADLFGNLIFPDAVAGRWLVGENMLAGALRDMVTPSAFGHPEHAVQMNPGCLATSDRCVHTWSGVPNRAWVFMADGNVPFSSHPGIGRTTLAILAYRTLNERLIASDGFLNLRAAMESTCRSSIGHSIFGSILTAEDCDHVAASFDATGISPLVMHGYDRFTTGLFGSGHFVSENQGLRFFRGCTLGDLTIRGVHQNGSIRTSNIAGGLVVDFDGEWGTYVTSRGSATDPADRSVSYRVWSTWFKTGRVSLLETVAPAPGVAPQDCYTPEPPTPAPGSPPQPAPHLRTLYSTQRVNHWATFFNGGRFNDLVNIGVSMPQGCQVLAVLGQHDHRGHVEGSPGANIHHGNHGFTMSALLPGDPRSLMALAHTWHNWDSSIGARVVYHVIEPHGVDCSVPGATQDVY